MQISCEKFSRHFTNDQQQSVARLPFHKWDQSSLTYFFFVVADAHTRFSRYFSVKWQRLNRYIYFLAFNWQQNHQNWNKAAVYCACCLNRQNFLILNFHKVVYQRKHRIFLLNYMAPFLRNLWRKWLTFAKVMMKYQVSCVVLTHSA